MECSALIEKFSAHAYDCSEGVRTRENTNKAVRLFSGFVVENRDKFRNKGDLYRMMRAYLNILLYAKKKVKVEEALADIDGLDGHLRNEIVGLSKPGRYCSITRTLRRRDEAYGREFLDLIEAFTTTSQYDGLWEAFEKFRDGTQSSNTASLTGILSSLQPQQFMVYNKRSALPLRGTPCEDLENVRLDQYRRFNGVYRQVSENTRRSLVELDVIANGRY